MIGGKRSHEFDPPSDRPLDRDRVEDLASGSDAATINEGQRLAKEVLGARKTPSHAKAERP